MGKTKSRWWTRQRVDGRHGKEFMMGMARVNGGQDKRVDDRHGKELLMGKTKELMVGKTKS